jgi:hypothetical protein
MLCLRVDLLLFWVFTSSCSRFEGFRRSSHGPVVPSCAITPKVRNGVVPSGLRGNCGQGEILHTQLRALAWYRRRQQDLVSRQLTLHRCSSVLNRRMKYNGVWDNPSHRAGRRLGGESGDIWLAFAQNALDEDRLSTRVVVGKGKEAGASPLSRRGGATTSMSSKDNHKQVRMSG